MSSQDFFEETSKNFNFVNHNKVDYDSFFEFQKNRDNYMKSLEKDEEKEALLKNVKLWDSKTPARWNGASLSKLEDKNIKIKLSKEIKTHVEPQSFFLTGPVDSGKTYSAYAIYRRYIRMGLISPSEIFRTSESELLNYVNSGFAGRDKINRILSKSFKGMIFDSVGEAEYSEAENKMIDRLIEKLYSDNVSVIFVSSKNPNSWLRDLSENTETRVKKLVEDRLIKFPQRKSDTADESSVWDEVNRNNDNDIFNKFKG